MKTTISKAWTFDAAHQLPNHDGKCAQPHGHTYSVEVAVTGEPRVVVGNNSIKMAPFPDEGMVVDFAVLSNIWNQLKPVLDHQDLNDTLQHEVQRTTSELLAAWLYEQFDAFMPDGVDVDFVRVSETPATWAMVEG